MIKAKKKTYTIDRVCKNDTTSESRNWKGTKCASERLWRSVDETVGYNRPTEAWKVIANVRRNNNTKNRANSSCTRMDKALHKASTRERSDLYKSGEYRVYVGYY